MREITVLFVVGGREKGTEPGRQLPFGGWKRRKGKRGAESVTVWYLMEGKENIYEIKARSSTFIGNKRINR
ncbi:hypothetical protein [Niallia circulans]|uniref:hypothetical protein n=1 Tax=Niallia circulans TaxID=1397 RepID=UPI0026EEB4A1|nr:hypothetical protein [Niallia circulans]